MKTNTYMMNWTMFKVLAGLTYRDKRGIEHVRPWAYSRRIFSRYVGDVESCINNERPLMNRVRIAIS